MPHRSRSPPRPGCGSGRRPGVRSCDQAVPVQASHRQPSSIRSVSFRKHSGTAGRPDPGGQAPRCSKCGRAEALAHHRFCSEGRSEPRHLQADSWLRPAIQKRFQYRKAFNATATGTGEADGYGGGREETREPDAGNHPARHQLPVTRLRAVSVRGSGPSNWWSPPSSACGYQGVWTLIRSRQMPLSQVAAAAAPLGHALRSAGS
jgi:hypothetical protein